MTVQIDGVAIPASMVNRGNYRFPAAEIVGRTGEGLAVEAPTRSIEWTFSHLTATELAFWTTTILAGARTKKCTNNVFYDPTAGGAEVAFSSCVLDSPDLAQSPRGGYYRSVTIKISGIMP